MNFVYGYLLQTEKKRELKIMIHHSKKDYSSETAKMCTLVNEPVVEQ